MKGETIGERYELVELCGTGGMSSVWKAHDRMLDRSVAIKILDERYGEDEEYVERFRREAHAVARLSHPNIVTVIDRGEEDGRQFIVFEFVEGENLKRLIERESPLPFSEVVRIGLDVARGLAFAHEHGLVHRDVKPQNVLLDGDGRPKVTDFGIVRSLDVERGVTQTGTVLGTSNYLSPEQASGERVDEKSDVYSLGCVLFELVTGEVPFPGEHFVAVAMRHIHEPPPSVLERRPDTPPRLAAVVERALEKDPAERLTMYELIAELEAALSPGTEATVAFRPRPVRRRVSWPLALAVAGVALVGAAAIGAVAFSNDGSGPRAAREKVQLRAVASYDPFGDDGVEHPREVEYATDGDPATVWKTSSYRYGGGSLDKPGVGLVLSTSRAAELEAIQVTTDTSGFKAEIRANGRRVSRSQIVSGTTTFAIAKGTRSSRWIFWITNLGPHSQVRVSELTAVTS